MANPEDTTILTDEFVDEHAPAVSGSVAPPHSDASDRLLFFFTGFDPRGAAFYHRLFRSRIAQRNASHDETLALGGRQRIARWASVWTTLWRGAPSPTGGKPQTMRTRMHFMRWDDIVRLHWRRTPRQLARDYLHVYGAGLVQGVLFRTWRQAPGAFRLAIFPLVVAVFSLMCGVTVVGGALFWGSGRTYAAVSAGLIAGGIIWRLAAFWLDCEWLLRVYAFTRQQGALAIPALETRLDSMASHIVEAVEARMRQPATAPLREVMLVGYSTGTLMAATVMARALPRLVELIVSRRTNHEATLSLLTLGQCIPAATNWPAAAELRRELDLLAGCELLTWYDYSSALDRAAFWRTTPWAMPTRMKARQQSPILDGNPGRPAFAVLRSERRDTHPEYFQTSKDRQHKDVYDFLQLTCGPETLAERHAAYEFVRSLKA